MSDALSGTQYLLRAGEYRATIASVGASLRELAFRGRHLVVPFAADEVRPLYRGATLAPWPNRVVDGRYRFDGGNHQLALNEPGRGHALHGLLAWSNYTATAVTPSQVVLEAMLEAQAGYPWRLLIETTFTLSSEGLTQTIRARNDCRSPAPWGAGPHPYLVAGIGHVDDWLLHLPAAHVLEVDAERLSPVSLEPVEVSPIRFDFRRPRRIEDAEIDHAFTGLARDASGRAKVALTSVNGQGVAISFDGTCRWVQIHTADLPGGPGQPGHRCGLAVEPMTCSPDAYNAHRYKFDTGLQVALPGEWTASAEWMICAIQGTGASDQPFR